MSQLDALRRKDAAMMPLGTLMGFEVESVEPGAANVKMICDQRHQNVFGYTHGGTIFTLADTAIGLAHIASLSPEETGTTVESKINYLRPALGGLLRSEARCVKRGQNLSFFECDVFDERDRLIARANATMMAIRDERSAGRDVLHKVEAEPSSRKKEVL
ncbi:PaaI family thioesterase [Granulicella sp. S190]|uniref:PaaI family thioesterase n=1 Tax=Granulicella sp. S190 TaxID=1747226 RepID=UPI00131E74F0|nr:PaaI family thioesterase [Granulicella sp. S190]